jgi:hypothetical protein
MRISLPKHKHRKARDGKAYLDVKLTLSREKNLEVTVNVMYCNAGVLHSHVQNLYRTPPDTQRIERPGERGMWVVVCCYLLHVTPPPPPPLIPPTPGICRTACGHVIRISWRKETPPPSPTPPTDYGQILATSLKVEGRPPFRSLTVW